ncbi:MAG: coagulation factor 5/8 type domain-containing protein, partial [Nonomuraea sp.]|nr:coagulation factor 5/8 type domain-containing protein [Nonomuraea sp.]
MARGSRLAGTALAVVLAGAGLPSLAPAAYAASSAYFVDPNGDDNADGRSPATAWKSLGKVNAQTFQPGDTVGFISGGQWTG